MYALYFAGTDEDGNKPTWLVDTQGRIIVFQMQSTAELVRDLLWSGKEEITVLPFDNSAEFVNSAFEKRYLKSWRNR